MAAKELLEFKDPSGAIVKYDPDMFEIIENPVNNVHKSYLHFKDDYEGPISLPEGLTSTYDMFFRCHIKSGCYFENFDTSNVENMSNMFVLCDMPDGFTLGDKFDTSNVKNMEDMFNDCDMPDGFTLGDKFDTSNVENMMSMFNYCEIPDGFTLGDKFDTSNVKNMEGMFEHCKMSDGFTLGDKFDTSNVENMDFMFEHCKMSDGSDVNSINDLKLDVKESEPKKQSALNALKREKYKMDRNELESEMSNDRDMTDE